MDEVETGREGVGGGERASEEVGKRKEGKG